MAFGKVFSVLSVDARRLLEGFACFRAVAATTNWYCGAAFLSSGGSVVSLVGLGALYVVCIGIGYSGVGLFAAGRRRMTTRGALSAAFCLSALSPLAFVSLGPVAFAALHGLGHGCYYLGWHAHLLRHSEDEERDGFMAVCMAIVQAWQVAFPLAAWLGFAAARSASSDSGVALLVILSVFAVAGAVVTFRLSPTEIPVCSPRRVRDLLLDRSRLTTNAWAGLLRVDAAEGYVLSAIASASMLSGLPELAALQLGVGVAGLCAATALARFARSSDRRRSVLLGGVGMAFSSVLFPLASGFGAVALGGLLSLRSVAGSLWGAASSALEVSLGSAANPTAAMEAMIARDVAVCVGRVAFFALLLPLAFFVSDERTFSALAFGALSVCYLVSTLLTLRVFFSSASP